MVKIPISHIPEQLFILYSDYMNFEKILPLRPLSDFTLRQIPNITWEMIARTQGISPLLFEQLTDFSYVKLSGPRRELNGFAVNNHIIGMRKYEIKEYDWVLYANRAKLNQEHFVDHFVAFAKNNIVFDEEETLLILKALSQNPFLPESKKEALRLYSEMDSEDKSKNDNIALSPSRIKATQEPQPDTDRHPDKNDFSFSSQDADGESLFSN